MRYFGKYCDVISLRIVAVESWLLKLEPLQLLPMLMLACNIACILLASLDFSGCHRSFSGVFSFFFSFSCKPDL